MEEQHKLRQQLTRTIPLLFEEDAKIINTNELRRMIKEYKSWQHKGWATLCQRSGFHNVSLFKQFVEDNVKLDPETEVELAVKALRLINRDVRCPMPSVVSITELSGRVPLVPSTDIINTLSDMADDVDDDAITHVYDNHNTIRNKICKVKQLYEVQQKEMVPISKVSTNKSGLSLFLSGKEQVKGQIHDIYVNSYTFFEKLRIATNCPKSQHRRRCEQEVASGQVEAVPRKRVVDGNKRPSSNLHLHTHATQDEQLETRSTLSGASDSSFSVLVKRPKRM